MTAEEYEYRQNDMYELLEPNTHSGPYYGLNTAINGAINRIKGLKLPRYYHVHIIPRNREYKPENAIVSVFIDSDGCFQLRSDERPFNTLKAGDRFIHDSIHYIAVSDIRISWSNLTMMINAVRLNDGELTQVEDDRMVLRYQLRKDN